MMARTAERNALLQQTQRGGTEVFSAASNCPSAGPLQEEASLRLQWEQGTKPYAASLS